MTRNPKVHKKKDCPMRKACPWQPCQGFNVKLRVLFGFWVSGIRGSGTVTLNPKLHRIYMGGCQNYGPVLGPYYNTAPIISGTQKVP